MAINYQYRLLLLVLTSIAVGYLYRSCQFAGEQKWSHGISPLTEEAGDSTPALLSSSDILLDLAGSPNLLDAELSLGEWVSKAPTHEIERLLERLAFAPDEQYWRDQALLVASLWATRDPDGARAFVLSHGDYRNNQGLSYEVGKTWACQRPEVARRWLREQKDFENGVGTGVVVGLSAVNPDMAVEFVSRGMILDTGFRKELHEILAHVGKRGTEYLGAWLAQIHNKANRKDMYESVATNVNYKLEDKARILLGCPDKSVREKCIAQATWFYEDSNMEIIYEFLGKFRTDDIGLALVSLLFSRPDDQTLIKEVNNLPDQSKESSILRFLTEECESEEDRMEALSRLVRDSKERIAYNKRLEQYWNENW